MSCLVPALGFLRGGQGAGQAASMLWPGSLNGSQRRRMSVNALLALKATSLILPSILFPLFSPTSFSEPWQDLYSLPPQDMQGHYLSPIASPGSLSCLSINNGRDPELGLLSLDRDWPSGAERG